MSENDFAAVIGVHKSTVKRWEGSSGSPAIDNIIKAAAFFGVFCEELMNDEISLETVLKNAEKT